MIDTDAIKHRMAMKRLSHGDLALRAGVARSAVTKLLLGIGNPKYTTIFGIVRALELTGAEIEQIFFRK